MKNDYIEISGEKYRVEFNWNAITNFLESENLSLADADDLRQLKPSQITGLVYQGIREGCRMDAAQFPFTKLQFGEMVRPPEIGELLLIYKRQTEVKKQAPKPEAKKKKSLNLFRSKGSSN